MSHVLGVDAGGTKTIAAVADENGRVDGVGLAGSANFQTCGVAGARNQIQRAVAAAVEMAGLQPNQLEAVCYGVAGADRPVTGWRTTPSSPCGRAHPTGWASP
jgi:N-acetylglucosamine kinase-like BadF-type ATPase